MWFYPERIRVKYLCKRVGSAETFNLFADKVLMLGGGGTVELGDGRYGLTLPVPDYLNNEDILRI